MIEALSYFNALRQGTFLDVIFWKQLRHQIVLMHGKSMIVALPILKSGCCWRVGNGESLKVYLDKWLPKCPPNRILQWG